MESTRHTNNNKSIRHRCSDEQQHEPETRDNSSPLLHEKQKKGSKLRIQSSRFTYFNDTTLEPTAEVSSVESHSSQQATNPNTVQAVHEQTQKSKKINPRSEIERKKKTELCRNYMRTGTCKYQNECSYAHGHEELRSKTEINLHYKSKVCSAYEKGICPYGSRCQYIHNDESYRDIFNAYCERICLWIDRNRRLDLDSIMRKTHAYEKRRINLVETILELERLHTCEQEQNRGQMPNSLEVKPSVSESSESLKSDTNSSISDQAVENENCPGSEIEPEQTLIKTRSRTGSNDTAASQNNK